MKLLLILAITITVLPAQADDLINLLGDGKDTSSTEALIEGGDKRFSVRSIVKGPRAEANIFASFFDKGNWEKALYQWKSGSTSAYRRSNTGKAIYGFLLYKNGLKVSGIESLLSASPKSIAKPIMALWKRLLNGGEKEWMYVSTPWNPAWSNVFGVGTEVRLRARQLVGPKYDTQVRRLIRKAKADSWERSWLEWQLVLNLAMKDKTGKAAKFLSHMMKAKNNPVGKDLMQVTAARMLYQNGYLDASKKYYEKVDKSSDYWLEAQEEIAWTYIRKGEPQNSLAITQTLVNRAFKRTVGPETLFLRSLGQLKVCDYPAVVKSMADFRERFRPRAVKMMKLQKTAETKKVQEFFDRTVAKDLTLKGIGEMADEVPRYSTRDQILTHLIRAQDIVSKEAKLADRIYARSLTGGTDKVGFQGGIKYFQLDIQSRARKAKSAAFSRLQTLATQEMDEIKKMLDKFHIVEAELIQQISAAESVIAASSRTMDKKTGTTGSKAQDKMEYPFEEKEIWFDELANYQVNVKKGCQARKL